MRRSSERQNLNESCARRDARSRQVFLGASFVEVALAFLFEVLKLNWSRYIQAQKAHRLRAQTKPTRTSRADEGEGKG